MGNEKNEPHRLLKGWKLKNNLSYHWISRELEYRWSADHIGKVFNGRRNPCPELKEKLAELTGIHVLKGMR